MTTVYIFEIDRMKIAGYLSHIGSALAGSDVIDVNWLTGASKFIMFGSAGSLDSNITNGKFVIPTATYREEGLSYNYVAPLYTVIVDRHTLLSKDGKRPRCYLQCVKYAWDKWVVRPALGLLFGNDNIDELLNDEKFMKKLKTNKQFKQLIETIVVNYFEHSDETNSDLFIDLEAKFVEIIKKWYEENNIDTCDNFDTVNDEITFESKINESPLRTPISYKKTRRLLDSP